MKDMGISVADVAIIGWQHVAGLSIFYTVMLLLLDAI
jgi:hypothetical protein